MNRTIKRILAIAGLATISLLLAFALGEAYIRAFHPQVSPLGFNYLMPDERLRYRNRPDCTLTFARDEINADFFTNSKGFRNVEERGDATRGKTVLFLGDSFTFGHGVRQIEVFSARFKERAVRDGKNVNIINAGTIGYGTDQEYLFLRDQGVALNPDLVVVNMYINDPADNIWRSLFYLDETGTLIENPALRYTPAMKLRWFLSRSQLYIFLTQRFGPVIGKKWGWENVNGTLGVLTGTDFVDYLFKWPVYNDEDVRKMNRDHWYPLVDPGDLYNHKYGREVWDYSMRLQSKILDKMIALLSEKEIPFLFVLLPTKDQATGAKSLYDGFQNELVPFFDKNNVPYLNLKNHKKLEPGLYFKTDSHFNPRGNEFLGDVLYDHITGAMLPL